MFENLVFLTPYSRGHFVNSYAINAKELDSISDLWPWMTGKEMDYHLKKLADFSTWAEQGLVLP